jgi:hypothetical protein
MRKKVACLLGTILISGALLVVAGTPETSLADVYRWEDDSGVIHFTDSPSNIPEKYRNRKKMILQGPPDSGQSSLSTMEASPAAMPGRPSQRVPPSPAPGEQAPPTEDGSREAEQLRARIAAKEQFIAGIDRKRSHALNPMGNRFVSPEDLELYKKYSDELPKDRERLREIEPSGR